MKAALLSMFAVALAGHPAFALSPVTYKFTGTVLTETGGFVTVGQKIRISIVFDQDYPANTMTQTEAVYEGGSLDGEPNAILSAKFDGQSIVSGINGMYVEKNNGGVTGYFLFSSDPEAGPGYQVSFSSSMRNAVKNLQIPGRIAPHRFQSATFAISSGSTQPNYYYTGTIDQR